MPSASALPCGSPSPILRSSFLLPRGGLRATPAAEDGSCPCCHLPSLSQLLGLRCNEFVRSAQQTPGGTSVVASGDLGTPQTHPALMLRRFPPPWPCPQLRACGERPRDSQWSCRAGISARPGQRAEVVAGTAATSDLSPGKGSHSAGPALRAHGHTQLYSRAKQKKAAILFAEGVINISAPGTQRGSRNLPHSARRARLCSLYRFVIGRQNEEGGLGNSTGFEQVQLPWNGLCGLGLAGWLPCGRLLSRGV